MEAMIFKIGTKNKNLIEDVQRRAIKLVHVVVVVVVVERRTYRLTWHKLNTIASRTLHKNYREKN